jgi:hypothetical protein
MTTDVSCPQNQQCSTVHLVKEPTDWIELGHGVESWLTAAGLLVAGWWAYRSDWIKTREDARSEQGLREREREQREAQVAEQQRNRDWEQTKIAREINEKCLDDDQVQQVLTLVDCDGATCILTDASEKDAAKKYTYNCVNGEDAQAMRVFEKGTQPDEKQVFLRDCFDAWFYWMAVIEQYLQNGLIREKDIAFPSDYYLRNLRMDKALYEACQHYITAYGLSPHALAFMKRFADADALATTKPVLAAAGGLPVGPAS